MDRDVALDIARQFREKIHYAGDESQVTLFDETTLELIKFIEEKCASVVEKTPEQLFIISKPPNILRLIAAAVRGGL